MHKTRLTVAPPDERGEIHIVLCAIVTEEEVEALVSQYRLKKEWIDDATDTRATADVMGYTFYKECV